MLKIFKNRIVLELLGILLLSLLIWFAGPYFAFAERRPLAGELPRLIAIALIVAIWAAIKLVGFLKASSASKKLASAVTAQPDPAPSSDEAQLRERFEEAIAALRESRGRDHSLYSEPWYVIIGAPGSGKSTLLQNSGLRFPLGKKFGRDAVRGVGGTRNCDWWFTDEAIFLDTAGRFTTQDSDPGSDARAWREFLALLKKYRSRRPVNGIILTVSVGDLLTLTGPGRDAQIAAARRRLEELNRDLRVRLPVYLLVTKCDLMSGFTEYFDDLPAEARKQVWGTTFPYEQTVSGRAPELFAEEFDQLVGRLNERMWQRLEEEPEARRRAKIFSFPQQLAALREVLSQFVTNVFAGTRMDARALLRGVYFTSGTQEGTPIDRLLGSVGRAFAFEPQEMPRAAAGHGKAYFIERLLTEVVLPERGLAGVNRRLELQIAGAQLVFYIGLGIITVVVVGALTVSYAGNREYLESVHHELARVDATELPAGATVEQIAVRLDQVRGIVGAANRYPGGAPWNMRWGLYAGSSIAQAAQDAYHRMLNGLLAPEIAALFRKELDSHVGKPETLYEYLKAYLMLGGKGRPDSVYLKTLTDIEWENHFASDAALVADLKKHSDSLFENSGSVRPTPIDGDAVDQARNTIRNTPGGLPALMYDELKMDYPADAPGAMRLDNAAGLGLDETLTRRGGRSWKTPISALYTKTVFDKVAAPLGTAELVTRFAQEGWVLGDSVVSLAHAPELTQKVLGLYENDYIVAWDQVVNDLQLPPLKDLEKMKALLATLSSKEGSPLRGLLKTIDENTFLVKPDEDNAGSQGALSKMEQAMRSQLNKIVGSSAAKAGPKPGTQVTEHFAPIHALLSGPPGQARLDAVLDKIAVVAQGISACGPGIGQKSAEQCAKQDPASVKALGQEAKTLPPSVGTLVAAIATAVDRAVVQGGAKDLIGSYDTEVRQECQDVIGSRYPFNPNSREDVPLKDFGHVFGYGGLFDTFYKAHLADLVDTRTRPWHWKTSESGALPAPEALLRRFEAAEAIRGMYFPSGSDKPEFSFSLAPATLDTEAMRVELNVDGQTLDYSHGPIRATPMKWPGPANGNAGIVFAERGGGHPNLAYQGPWAWFRLLDDGRPQLEQGRYRLSYAMGSSHSATFTLQADSLHNPLQKNDLQRFACAF